MLMLSLVATLLTGAVALTGPGGGVVPNAPMAIRNPVSASTAPVADEARPVTRRIDVEMQDNAFSPKSIDVNVGETVTFVFTNVGNRVHDAFIGDTAAQQRHEREMRETPEGHDHAHEGGVTVHPGRSGSLEYTFDTPGSLEIGCHQPGHYNDGMMAVLNVRPARAA